MSHDKDDGADAGESRARRNTPVILPATVEDTLKRIARVRLRLRESRGLHERTEQLLDELAHLVEHGGADDHVRQLEMRLSLHFDELSEFMRDEMSSILAGLGRALWRLSQT